MSKTEENIKRLAKALKRACDEHGRPNTFAPSELAFIGGPSALMQGRIGNSPFLRGTVLEALGGEQWGRLEYSDRRWAV